MEATSAMSRVPSAFRQLVKKALSFAIPRHMFLTNCSPSSGAVYLTFDDGPAPDVTPRVLDALARENVKATFFLVGRLAERHPEIVKRIHAEGHTIGHHSYSHKNPLSLPTLAMHEDVRRSIEVLQGILGFRVRLYRPPTGKLRVLDFMSAWSLRQTIALWSVDPRDYAQPSSDDLVRWFQTRELCRGDVILLHDSEPQTAEAVPAIVARARSLGFHLERMR